MMRRALAMGAAVLAAVPVVLSPLTVTALSPMTPSEWMEYYNVSSSDLVVGALWTDEFFPVYYTMIMNVVQLPYINGVPIKPVDYGGKDTYAGYYLRDGVRHRGSVTLWGERWYQNGVPTGSLPLFVGDDCSLAVTASYLYEPTSNKGIRVNYGLSGNRPSCEFLAYSGALTFDVAASGFAYGTRHKDMDGYGSITVLLGSIRAASAPEMPQNSDQVLGIGSGVSSPLLGESTPMPDMPTSTLYPEINQDNALDYIHDVLNPWALEQSPDIEPYLLQDAPPAPEYPVQETWAEEADWPEGNLLPTIPAADYSVDIPETMTEGAAFWWRCLGVLFDGLGITALVVGLLALGIVLYFVLR